MFIKNILIYTYTHLYIYNLNGMDDLLDELVMGEIDDGVLYAKTPKGESIDIYPCEVNVKNFFQKATVLYGPSGSGKTILTKYIMRKLSKCFPIVFVFCPTNAENEAFTNIVPEPFIYDRVTVETLKHIYSRAGFASSVYKKANRLEVLRSLFLKIADYKQRQNEIYVISQRNKTIKQIQETGKSKFDIRRDSNDITEKANETLRKLYKANIKHADRKNLFSGVVLSDSEAMSLKYISYNPEILIVFDDCASELQALGRKLSKDTTLLDFFFRGRHSHLTTLYTMQDDTALLSAMRKNAQNSIFCTRESAVGFFGRSSNNISNVDKKKYIAAAEEVFQDYNQRDYKKLIFMREESKHPIRYIKGDEDDFHMCAKIIWRFCDRIKKKDDSIDEDSEWHQFFFS